jgi:hypothetical protein
MGRHANPCRQRVWIPVFYRRVGDRAFGIARKADISTFPGLVP